MSFYTIDHENYGYLYALKCDSLSTNEYMLGFTSNLKNRLQLYSSNHSNAEFVKIVPNVDFINTKLTTSTTNTDVTTTQLDYIQYRFDALMKLVDPYLVQDNIVECSYDILNRILDMVQSLLPVEIMGVILDVQVDVDMEQYYIHKEHALKTVDEYDGNKPSSCVQSPYIKFLVYKQNKPIKDESKYNMQDNTETLKQFCLLNNKYKQYVKRLHSEYMFTQKRFEFYQDLVDQCFNDVMKYRNEIKNLEVRFQHKEEQWNNFCASLNTQNYFLQNRNDELICKNNELIDSNADLKNELNRIQSDYISAVNNNTNELNATSKEISDLLHEVQDYSTRLHNLQCEYMQLQDEYSRCKDQLINVQDININWISKYNDLFDQYESCKNQLIDARNQVYDILHDDEKLLNKS